MGHESAVKLEESAEVIDLDARRDEKADFVLLVKLIILYLLVP